MSAAVVLEGSTGRVWSLDANAVAPAAAHEYMYDILPARRDNKDLNEKEYACSVRDDANVYGPQSVAVPGQMAGMGFLHERWGQLPWAAIVAPAQGLLADGFPYGPGLSQYPFATKQPFCAAFPRRLATSRRKASCPPPRRHLASPRYGAHASAFGPSGWLA